MKNSKRILSVALALLLVFALAACQSTPTTTGGTTGATTTKATTATTTAATTTTGTTAPPEPIVISTLHAGDNTPNPDNLVLQEITKLTGYIVEMTYVPGADYNTKLNALIAADDLPGANFGWSGYEGDEPYLSGDGRRPDDPVMPVFTYRHDDGNCSVTGGFVVRRPDLGLDGAYVFADYVSGRVWRADREGDEWQVTLLLDTGFNVSTFGEDASGELYLADHQGGAIYRLGD